MAIYAIGDIHGCFRTFKALLRKIGFDPSCDRLWLAGDLVDAGPDSLEVLRWARRHDGQIECVLGNHDLYLLARHWEICPIKRRDTLEAVLEAPDREELITWLRRRPLFFHQDDAALVHAGLLPEWDLTETLGYCRQIQDLLRSAEAKSFLELHFKKGRCCWDSDLRGEERLSCALAVLTLMRTCKSAGGLCLDFTGPPQDAPPGCRPWFDLRPPETDLKLYFGHWAALGFHTQPGYVALDSGCVWGRSLTAFRLEDQTVFQQPNLEG